MTIKTYTVRELCELTGYTEEDLSDLLDRENFWLDYEVGEGRYSEALLDLLLAQRAESMPAESREW